jgi:hypothetical protein
VIAGGWRIEGRRVVWTGAGEPAAR